MPWNKADLIEVEDHPSGETSVKIEFGKTGSPDTVVKEINIESVPSLKTKAINMVNKLNLLDSLALGAIDLTPEPVIEPDLDKLEFLKRLQKLRELRRLVDDGVISIDSKAIIEVQTWLSDKFKTEYFD